MLNLYLSKNATIPYQIIEGKIEYVFNATGTEVDNSRDAVWQSLTDEQRSEELENIYNLHNPPNWTNWQLAMLQDPVWNQVASQGGHLVSALYVLISQVQNSSATLENIVALFQLLTKGVSQEQKQAWAKLAKAHNLPDDFVSAITLN